MSRVTKFVWIANVLVVGLIITSLFVDMGPHDPSAVALVSIQLVGLPLLVAMLVWRGRRFAAFITSADAVVAVYLLGFLVVRREAITGIGITVIVLIELLTWCSVAVAVWAPRTIRP
jgi:hypothetical protein